MSIIISLLVIFGGGFALGWFYAYAKAFDDAYRRMMRLVDKVDKINRENRS